MKIVAYVIIIISLLQSGCSNRLRTRISFSEVEVPVILGKVQMIGGNLNQDGNKLCYFDVVSSSRSTYFELHPSKKPNSKPQDNTMLEQALREKDRWIAIDEIYIGTNAFFFGAFIRGMVLTYDAVAGAQGNVYSSTTKSSVDCGSKQTDTDNQWL